MMKREITPGVALFVKNEQGSYKWFIELGEAFIRHKAIDMLKEHRDRLRAVIPTIKHTQRKAKAIKKEKRIDYLMGRMIFFDEDFQTARTKLEVALKNNEL